jgi:hypothetical protein
MTRDAVDDPEGEDRDAECERDRETARPRDRSRMHATAAGQVEHPKALREPANEWCYRGGKKERENGGADEEEAGHSAER